MARKIVHQLIDDLDGTVLEPGTGDTVHFSLDGTAYEVDLTAEHADELRAALEPYVRAGRRLGRGSAAASSPAKSRRGSGAARDDLAEVRSWANANGHTVSDRGRVPAAVLEAYDAAN
ncbi:histone-like nucleoid-structuring protein Lsr2 [Microbacterium gorillae]|uniref:histone-like nucleoid-structuring protein Lsr2 n=1 Tax=Microbacterium gorillae TaxID=1231063 RepID=UPI00058DB499|nr:Lsr2 family protein [Microbacterium gorillae]